VHNLNLRFLSQQFEEDWRVYNNVLRRTNVTQYTTWLDLRGNHGENNLFAAILCKSVLFSKIHSGIRIQIQKRVSIGLSPLISQPNLADNLF
jgi:hypothetical protein